MTRIQISIEQLREDYSAETIEALLSLVGTKIVATMEAANPTHPEPTSRELVSEVQGALAISPATPNAVKSRPPKPL